MHPKWDFEKFYNQLGSEGFVIYPGKVGRVPNFRVGNIGHIFPGDIAAFIEAVGSATESLGIPLPQ